MNREVAGSSTGKGRARQSTTESTGAIPRKRMRRSQSEFGNSIFLEKMDGMNAFSAEDIDSPTQSCDRDVIFFDENEVVNTNLPFDDPGDQFFEVTEGDILSRLRDLQIECGDKIPVASGSRERSSTQYPKIIIRIVFPNRRVLQGTFRPAETIDTLYNFVRDFLSVRDVDFDLYTSPPKQVLKDKQSILYDNHLSPASRVYFGLQNDDFHDGTLSEQCETLKGSAANATLRHVRVLQMK